MSADPKIVYVSFATDVGWLGGVFVEAQDEMSAYVKVSLLGCNPGGEVAMTPPVPAALVKLEYRDRLLTDSEDLERAYAGELACAQPADYTHVDAVCPDCHEVGAHEVVDHDTVCADLKCCECGSVFACDVEGLPS